MLLKETNYGYPTAGTSNLEALVFLAQTNSSNLLWHFQEKKNQYPPTFKCLDFWVMCHLPLQLRLFLPVEWEDWWKLK